MQIKSRHLIHLALLGACIVPLIWLVSQPRLALQTALRSIDMWWTFILPAMFPALLVSHLMFTIPAIHRRLMANVDDRQLIIVCKLFILGMLGGVPWQAAGIRRLHSSKLQTLIAVTFAHHPLWIWILLSQFADEERWPTLALAIVSYYLSICAMILIMLLRIRKISISVQSTREIDRLPRAFGEWLSSATIHAGKNTLKFGALFLFVSTASHVLIDLCESFTNVPLVQAATDTLLLFVANAEAGEQHIDHWLPLISCATLAWGGFLSHIWLQAEIAPIYLRYRSFVTYRLMQVGMAVGIYWLLDFGFSSGITTTLLVGKFAA